MTLEDSVRRHRLAILQRAALLGSVTQACREAGISRTLFYRWRRRYLRYGADGLRPRPIRPTRWPRQAIPALEHAVLAYALLWPTQGPARLAMQLRQPLWGGWRISASGVYAILRRHGLQTRWERLTRLEAHAATDGLLTDQSSSEENPMSTPAGLPCGVITISSFSASRRYLDRGHPHPERRQRVLDRVSRSPRAARSPRPLPRPSRLGGCAATDAQNGRS